MKVAAKIGWVLLGLFAISDGIGAMRYSLPAVPFPAPLDNFAAEFYVRRAAGSSGLLQGATASL